jgi:hypothetical protein
LEIGSFLVEAPEDNAYLGDCLLDILLLSGVTFEVVIGLFQVFKIILDPLKTLSKCLHLVSSESDVDRDFTFSHLLFDCLNFVL